MICILTTSLCFQMVIAKIEVPVKDKIDLYIEELIDKESGGKQFAINKNEIHGASYGILQFRISTFEHFGKRYGLPHDDIFNKKQQIAIAKRMLEENRWEHWRLSVKKIGYLPEI